VRSKCTRRFWKLHDALPPQVQKLASKSYDLWRRDHNYPSLDFKKLKGGNGNRFSVRIGIIIAPVANRSPTPLNGCGSVATKITTS